MHTFCTDAKGFNGATLAAFPNKRDKYGSTGSCWLYREGDSEVRR